MIPDINTGCLYNEWNPKGVVTVGIKLSLRKAIHAIRNNVCDIRDGGIYNYCVIEKFECSIYPERFESIFFKWNTQEQKYARISTPDKIFASWASRTIIG